MEPIDKGDSRFGYYVWQRHKLVTRSNEMSDFRLGIRNGWIACEREVIHSKVSLTFRKLLIYQKDCWLPQSSGSTHQNFQRWSI